jgi:hypothetical protein
MALQISWRRKVGDDSQATRSVNHIRSELSRAGGSRKATGSSTGGTLVLTPRRVLV